MDGFGHTSSVWATPFVGYSSTSWVAGVPTYGLWPSMFQSNEAILSSLGYDADVERIPSATAVIEGHISV